MLIPEVQGQFNLYDSTTTIYEIVLWAFFVIFMFFIFYMIFRAFKFAENPEKEKMKKWGLLMDDE
jgi:phosphotransferase system  glucose/maltose/N-acetylglucosamine-specific IIC component